MQLNPQHLTVAKLLEGRLFRIPEYQRAYSWQTRQRKDLFKDIKEALRTDQDHFMATVVALAGQKRIIAADEFQSVELVDGQQRMTTLIILLKAIEKAAKTEDAAETKIKNDLKLLLQKGDDHSLVLLQTNHDSSNVFTNYLRSGTIETASVVTASDQNLIDAAVECEKFVEKWMEKSSLISLLATIRNKLSMIYHEITDESMVYRVFEVLNSRGLDVKWIDKTKSQLMGAIFEYVEKDTRPEGLKEMQTIWQAIYRCLGLQQSLGDEALAFAGTWSSKTRPNRILSEEDASITMVKRAGKELPNIIESAQWLKDVVDKVNELNADVRRSAVTRIRHARFLAIAIMLRKFGNEVESDLLNAWERVTFRIFGLGDADTRNKIGDYVRLGYDILTSDMNHADIKTNIANLGQGFSIDEVITGKDYWDECYHGWSDELRYLLFRYDEHLAELAGQKINAQQWGKIWAMDPSKSIEHITPQSSDRAYIHHLGNLTMLPPGVNSSLKDKPPHKKAKRYIECGLQETVSVGNSIEAEGKWSKRLVIERAARLEEFIRSEWAD